MRCRTRDKGKINKTSTSDPPHGDVCSCQRQFTYIMSSDLIVDRYRVFKVTLLVGLIALYLHDTINVEMDHRFFRTRYFFNLAFWFQQRFWQLNNLSNPLAIVVGWDMPSSMKPPRALDVSGI